MQGVSPSSGNGKLSMMDLWRKQMELARLKEGETKGVLSTAKERAKLEQEIRTGKVECATCASRKYKDRSDDASVSFQTPQNISPERSKAAVLGHEMEHVQNRGAEAKRENKQVQSTVSLRYAICPECGAQYVAGGETRTVTRTMSQGREELPPEKGVQLNVRA